MAITIVESAFCEFSLNLRCTASSASRAVAKGPVGPVLAGPTFS